MTQPGSSFVMPLQGVHAPSTPFSNVRFVLQQELVSCPGRVWHFMLETLEDALSLHDDEGCGWRSRGMLLWMDEHRPPAGQAPRRVLEIRACDSAGYLVTLEGGNHVFSRSSQTKEASPVSVVSEPVFASAPAG